MWRKSLNYMDTEKQLSINQLTFDMCRALDIRPFVKFIWMGSFHYV